MNQNKQRQHQDFQAEGTKELVKRERNHNNLTSPSHEESPGNIDEEMIFLMKMKNHEEEDLKFLKDQCKQGALPLKYNLPN